MFTGFLYHLRGYGLPVSSTEWLALMESLYRGHARSNLSAFYHLSRALLVKKEAQFDLFDRAFASYFEGLEDTFELDEELWKWLEQPELPRELTPEELEQLKALDLDELREQFEERLKEQDERHDGGNKWVGTGGTSPFGNGGTHPTGVRVGGTGGGRTAVQVAEDRRYRNLRTDRILDTRQVSVALRRLRRLARGDGPEELQLQKTIDKSAREGGEIDLVFEPPKENRIKLLLLMDVGGSMDPHAELCERMFSAAHKASHFQAFKSYYFHNCPYDTLYTDMWRGEGEPTERVLATIDNRWTVIFVGDAWMSPYELSHVGGALYYGHKNPVRGIEWLVKFRERCPKSAWLNPEPERIWNAESITMIRQVFPMYELTVDGLTACIDMLRGARKLAA
jgi:uncharacterized protein with von Willebrand factor type A (vWA) domain